MHKHFPEHPSFMVPVATLDGPGLSRTQVMLRPDQLSCALPSPLREASLPLCQPTLPLVTWEQSKFLHHFGRAGEERRGRGLRCCWWKACRGLKWWLWNERCNGRSISLTSHISWNFSRQEKQMAMNSQMHHRDKGWVGGCEEAAAIGSRQRGKAHPVESTYGESEWETEDGTIWPETRAHDTWSQGQGQLLPGQTGELLSSVPAGDSFLHLRKWLF